VVFDHTQDNGSLNDILQLADVSRPVVSLKQCERLARYVPELLAGLLGIAIDKVFDQ
jgi:hypothetical protein